MKSLIRNSKSKSKSRGARTIAELVRASLRGIGYEETTENGDAERGVRTKYSF